MFGLFGSKVTEMDSSNKLKEGFLKKESRHRKIWRERWVVLTELNLYTFETKGVYRNPTEVIDVKTIKTVKTDEKKSGFNFVSKNDIIIFLKKQKIMTDTMVFNFEAKTFEEKEGWIGAIGKAMVKTGNNVFMGNV